jgi:hypothetical protein
LFSSIAGSGLDICSFAFLTLLFRISEKTATPTSVILMAINTVVGFAYRKYGQEGVEYNAWCMFLVCAPGITHSDCIDICSTKLFVSYMTSSALYVQYVFSGMYWSSFGQCTG